MYETDLVLSPQHIRKGMVKCVCAVNQMMVGRAWSPRSSSLLWLAHQTDSDTSDSYIAIVSNVNYTTTLIPFPNSNSVNNHSHPVSIFKLYIIYLYATSTHTNPPPLHIQSIPESRPDSAFPPLSATHHPLPPFFFLSYFRSIVIWLSPKAWG